MRNKLKSKRVSFFGFLLFFVVFSSLTFFTTEIQDEDTLHPDKIDLAAAFSNLYESSDPLELGHSVIIRVEVQDPQGFKEVYIEYDGANHSLTNIPGTDTYEYNWTPSSTGIHPYTLYSKFNANKWNLLSDSITVVSDATPPTYQLIEKPKNGIRIGERIKIKIEVKDSHGIKQVFIIFDIANYSMENILGTDFWEYEFTAPNNKGTYTYTIYMEDNNNNLNYYTASIDVINGSSGGPEDNNIIWIPILIGAFGSIIGMVAVKSKRSSLKSTPITRDKTKKTMKLKSNVERETVSIECPICKIKLKILVPKTVINGSKQLTTLSIPGNKACEHHYQAFIDKNFIVRGYQKVDYEFDIGDLEDIEVIKDNNNGNNNKK
jgi:hypothetical protein